VGKANALISDESGEALLLTNVTPLQTKGLIAPAGRLVSIQLGVHETLKATPRRDNKVGKWTR